MCDEDSKEEDQNIEKLARAVGVQNNADVILYCGPIDREGFQKVFSLLRSGERQENAFLILNTYGGDAHAGFRIARTLNKNFKKFTVCVPGFCKSAGTLVALGADELVIGDEGELGPLDVQVRKRDEFDERGSGLDIMQALQVLQERSLDAFRRSLVDFKIGTRVTTKLASETATALTTGLFAPIYSQIDPVHLGELHRAMKIAYDYGGRLEKHNLKPGALDRLVAGYSSHGFVIDSEEADELFKNVRSLTTEESDLLDMLCNIVDSPSEKICVIHLNGENNDETLDEENTGTESGTRESAEESSQGGGKPGKEDDSSSRGPVTEFKKRAKPEKKRSLKG